MQNVGSEVVRDPEVNIAREQARFPRKLGKTGFGEFASGFRLGESHLEVSRTLLRKRGPNGGRPLPGSLEDELQQTPCGWPLILGDSPHFYYVSDHRQ
jgi:hypothetical protein